MQRAPRSIRIEPDPGGGLAIGCPDVARVTVIDSAGGIEFVVALDVPSSAVATRVAELLGHPSEADGKTLGYAFSNRDNIIDEATGLGAAGVRRGEPLYLWHGEEGSPAAAPAAAVRFARGELELVVADGNGDVIRRATASLDMTAGHLLRICARARPGVDARADVLLHERSRRIIDAETTLGDLGAVAGDVVRVIPGLAAAARGPAYKLELVVMDSTGSRLVRRQVPADVPAWRLCESLIEAFELPRAGPDGSTLHYVLHHAQTGRELAPAETLAEARVSAGDTVRVVAFFQCGGALP